MKDKTDAVTKEMVMREWERFSKSKVGKSCLGSKPDPEGNGLPVPRVMAAFLSGWNAGIHTFKQAIVAEIRELHRKGPGGVKKARKKARKTPMVFGQP